MTFPTILIVILDWISISSMPTSVGYGAGCVANDGRFFIFGGTEYNRSGESFSLVQIYTSTNDSWITITPILPSGASIADYWMSCAVDSRTGLMYLTGGWYRGNRFYIYNVGTNNITDLSSSSPFSLYGHGSFVANNGKLFVFGGGNFQLSQSSNSTYIYNVESRNWSVGAAMILGSLSFGYATDGSRFYAIGGAGSSGNLQKAQVYDISTNVWSLDNGTVLSGGVDNVAVAFLDGSLHSIGGSNTISVLFTHLIASLCGVYTFSGQCDDGNQCTANDTCQSNGQCIGTLIGDCLWNTGVSNNGVPLGSGLLDLHWTYYAELITSDSNLCSVDTPDPDATLFNKNPTAVGLAAGWVKPPSTAR